MYSRFRKSKSVFLIHDFFPVVLQAAPYPQSQYSTSRSYNNSVHIPLQKVLCTVIYDYCHLRFITEFSTNIYRVLPSYHLRYRRTRRQMARLRMMNQQVRVVKRYSRVVLQVESRLNHRYYKNIQQFISHHC